MLLATKIKEEENNNNNNNHNTTPNPYQQTRGKKTLEYDEFAAIMGDAIEEISDGIKDTRIRTTWFEQSKGKLLKLIKNRNEKYNEYCGEKNNEKKIILKKARSELIQGKREAKNEWLRTKADEMENLQKTDPRTSWKAIKEIAKGLFGHHKNTVQIKLKNKHGKLATTDKENAEIFKEHFSKLYNNKTTTTYDPTIIAELEQFRQPTNETLGQPPKWEEIRKALSKMENEKSPGPNKIPPEAFKNLQGLGYITLTNIIYDYWTNENNNNPTYTKLGLTILPKKGDLTDTNNYRGIALGDICAKIISSIITTRLTKYLQKIGIEEQYGSQYNKGCPDATFSLKTALQIIKEHNLSSYVLFVDLVKAYDSVNRELLWEILEIYGIPIELIKIIKKLHNNVYYIINVGKEKQKIIGTVGVKQGDNLGPILFIILVQAVSQTLDTHWKFNTPDFRMHGYNQEGNIKYNPDMMKKVRYQKKGTPFTHFKSYYVDDAAFIFLNRKDIEEGAKLIKLHFSRFGLTVHCGNKQTQKKSKTEAMFFPNSTYDTTNLSNDTQDIKLDNNHFFSFTNKFKYLGTYFTPKLTENEDISRRISSATRAFAKMKNVLTDTTIDIKIRLRIYDATVINILLWGCESWALTIEHRRKLEVAHHRFLRNIARITIYEVKENKIFSNKYLRQHLEKCYTIETIMELRRLRWLEKIAKMDKKRAPKKLINAWLPQPRPPHRPQQTIKIAFAKTLKKYNFNTRMNEWIKMAKSDRWAKHVEWKLALAPDTYKPYKFRR